MLLHGKIVMENGAEIPFELDVYKRQAFGITAVYFGCLVMIGYTTKMNLLRFGPILMGGLLTLIIVEVVMTLLGMDITTRGFTAIGLLLFTGITAYDTQKMKALYHSYEGDESMLSKLSIYSARCV